MVSLMVAEPEQAGFDQSLQTLPIDQAQRLSSVQNIGGQLKTNSNS